MHTFPRLRVPIRNPASYSQLDTFPGFTSRITDVAFELKTFVIGNVKQHIYECTQSGCRGCGCPAFAETPVLPVAIWDHLKMHVELCEGLVRSKVPQ